MTKVLIAAEGVTDSGWKTYDEKTGGFVEHDGVLQTLIKKCVDDPALEFTRAGRKDLKSVKLLDRRATPKEATKKRIAAYAKQNGCDGVAYHMDVDKEGFDARYAYIDDLLSAARKQNLRCVPIAPLRMLESWLLADEHSFPKPPTNPKLPKRPEGIWGAKSDDKSDYPKHYLKRVLEQFDLEPSRELFAELARNASVDVLRRKCPKSFQRFYDDVQRFA